MKITKISVRLIFVYFLMFSASCNMKSVDPMVLGKWKSGFLKSPDLGLVKYEFNFEKSNQYEFLTHLDKGETLGSSGSFQIEDKVLVAHSKIGYGLKNNEKVYKEKIDIVLKFELIRLDSNNLVLRELSGSSEELVSFQRVTKDKKIQAN